jgi:predicted transposase/invertase (TIGR01784 family)
MSRKLISFDWAIKKLLRSKANFGILEGFLSELLKFDIKILEILESESNPDYLYDKFNRVDLKVKDQQANIIIVEVQYSYESDYLQRILFGVSKTITEHLKEGDPYEAITKVISVNLLYFNLGIGTDYIYKGSTDFIGIHNNDQLKLSKKQQQKFEQKTIPQLFPEYYLININRFNDVAKDTLDEWIFFLKNEEIKEDFSAKGLIEAKEKLDLMKLPAEQRKAYEIYQDDLHYQASMFESNYGEGYLDGVDKGKTETIRETVLRMHKKGLDIEMIAEFAGITQNDVKNFLK